MTQEIVIGQDAEGNTTVSIPSMHRTFSLEPGAFVRVKTNGLVVIEKIDGEDLGFRRGKGVITPVMAVA
jgi:hypothetical protein